MSARNLDACALFSFKYSNQYCVRLSAEDLRVENVSTFQKPLGIELHNIQVKINPI